MLSINTNINAQQASTQIGRANAAVQNSSEKLTTGMAINKSADDVSGAALANRLANNSAKTAQFIKNANDGVNMIQAADNAVKQQQDLVARMQELAYKAENGTNTTEDTTLIQKEFDQLAKEVIRNESGAEFNGKALLDGSLDAAINVGTGSDNQINVDIINQAELGGVTITTGDTATTDKIVIGGVDIEVGVAITGADQKPQEVADALNASIATAQAAAKAELAAAADAAAADAAQAKIDALAGATVSVGANGLSVSTDNKVAITGEAKLGVATGTGITAREGIISDDGKINISLAGHADGDTWKTEVHDKLDSLAGKYNSDRADLGASQNRLEFATKNLEGTKQNIDRTLSATQDTNFATETAELAKAKVLAKTSQTMLSQANKSVEDVTSLLQ